MLLGVQTEEWPSGLVHLIVKGPFEEFGPHDSTSLVESLAAIDKISKPKISLAQIAKIKNQHGADAKHEMLAAKAALVAPQECKQLAAAEQLKVEAAETFKSTDSKHTMNTHCHTLGSKMNDDDISNDEDTKVALASIKCCACGENGHKASTCPKKKKGSKKVEAKTTSKMLARNASIAAKQGTLVLTAGRRKAMLMMQASRNCREEDVQC